MVGQEELKKYASQLMFAISGDESLRLEQEFAYYLENMALLNKIKGIEQLEPMIHPLIISDVILNDDVVADCLTKEEVLQNTGHVQEQQIKVPKVVG